uniref:Uncharacterized protein n=1 Tax=Arundo donax TaxID=35708 RepID=A0A0A8YR51_ARUDO
MPFACISDPILRKFKTALRTRPASLQ